MDDVERRLFEKLESIHHSCGQVCDTRVTGRPGKVDIAMLRGQTLARSVKP
jgi:hypothetical protein